jgi:hypothetical protein
MQLNPANQLEEIFIKAANEPEARAGFYSMLTGSEVFVIPRGETPVADGKLAPGTQLQLMSLRSGEQDYVVFFTSQQKIAQALGDGTHFLAMAGIDLLRLTKGAHLIMNPGSPIGKPFLPDEVAEIIQNNQ